MTQRQSISRSGSLLLILLCGFVLSSCQKESSDGGGGTVTATNQKPKIGTRWSYRFYTYNAIGGGVHSVETLEFKAKAEVVLGGDKWLNIVNSATDTTIYYLNEKVDGLYLYANNAPYLFCKTPAAINDTYNTFLSGFVESVVVKKVKDTLLTGVGDIPVNYYESTHSARIYNTIWYNEYAWVVKREEYRYMPISTIYYRYSSLNLDTITY